MGKSTNQPDWTDILTMISALEALHECRVELTVTAGSQGHNGIGTIGLLTRWDVLEGSAQPKTISTNQTWPNGHGRTFEGEVFNLLYVMDFMIVEVYQQRYLPEV